MMERNRSFVKSLAVLFLGIMLLVAGTGSVSRAAGSLLDIVQAEPGQKIYVADEAELLNETEKQNLIDTAKQLDDQYHVSVMILTTKDMKSSDIMEWIQDNYSQMEANGQAESSGIVLALSMEERDWGIVAIGDAENAFTTYGREKIGDQILSSLSDGNYYVAFHSFQTLADEFMQEAEEGSPFSENHPYKESVSLVLIIAISFALSLVVSLCIVLSWKKSMNTRIKREGATEYMKQESFILSRKSDRFLYRNLSRTKRQTSKGSGGGNMHSSHSGTSGKF